MSVNPKRPCKERIHQELLEKQRVIHKVRPSPKGRDSGGWLEKKNQESEEIIRAPMVLYENLEDLGQLPKTMPKSFVRPNYATVIKATVRAHNVLPKKNSYTPPTQAFSNSSLLKLKCRF